MIRKVHKPIFYIENHYASTGRTGHMIAANDTDDAIRIAEKFNIHYRPKGEVIRRTVRPTKGMSLVPGRRIWYETSFGTLSSWVNKKLVEV